jgi:aspartyl-tRNA(Asn)/glutamyl-tRNA(Gln) amidotransferase subunit C
MKIDDLKETAALAHLNMDEKELAGAFPAFEQMLGYFAAMQAADKDMDALAPAASSRAVSSGYFRLDNNSDTNSIDTNSNEALLDNAGERDGRFLVVPNVL